MHKFALFLLFAIFAVVGNTTAQIQITDQSDLYGQLDQLFSTSSTPQDQGAAALSVVYAHLGYTSPTSIAPSINGWVQSYLYTRYNSTDPVAILNALFSPASVQGDSAISTAGDAFISSLGVTPNSATGLSPAALANIASSEIATAIAYKNIEAQYPGTTLPTPPFQGWATVACNAVAAMPTTDPNYGASIGSLLGTLMNALGNLTPSDIQGLFGDTNSPSINSIVTNAVSSFKLIDPNGALATLTAFARISGAIAKNATGVNATNGSANLTSTINTAITDLGTVGYSYLLVQFASSIFTNGLLSLTDPNTTNLLSSIEKLDAFGGFKAADVLAVFNDVAANNYTNVNADLQKINQTVLTNSLGLAPGALQLALGSVLSLGKNVTGLDPTTLTQSVELALLERQPFPSALLPAWESISKDASGTPFYAVLNSANISQSALTTGWTNIFTAVGTTEAAALVSNLYTFDALNDQSDQDAYNVFASIYPAVQNANLWGSLTTDTQAFYTAAGLTSAWSHYNAQEGDASTILGMASQLFGQLNVSDPSYSDNSHFNSWSSLISAFADLGSVANGNTAIQNIFSANGDKVNTVVHNFTTNLQPNSSSQSLQSPMIALLAVGYYGSTTSALAALTDITNLNKNQLNALPALEGAVGDSGSSTTNSLTSLLTISNKILSSDPSATMPSGLLALLGDVGFPPPNFATAYPSVYTWYQAQSTTSSLKPKEETIQPKATTGPTPQPPSRTAPRFG